MKMASVGKWTRAAGAALSIMLAAAGSAQASVVFTGSRVAIGAGYTVDWGSLGGDLTPLAGSFTEGSVTVTGAGAFSIFSGATFNADFLATDSVLSLFDLGSGNPVAGAFDITFSSAVAAAGAQVQANQFGAFSGFIEAFDAANVSLGSFAVGGTNAGSGDGSAVFAGITSTAADIKRLVFSGFGAGAGINALSVQTEGGGGNVPEPGSLLIVATGLAMLGASRARRRSIR